MYFLVLNLKIYFLAGIFPIPDYLEKSVVNLLLHMLQVDPMKVIIFMKFSLGNI